MRNATQVAAVIADTLNSCPKFRAESAQVQQSAIAEVVRRFMATPDGARIVADAFALSLKEAA
jgi:hypothetical protein